jgi:hypothetical protein
MRQQALQATRLERPEQVALVQMMQARRAQQQELALEQEREQLCQLVAQT